MSESTKEAESNSTKGKAGIVSIAVLCSRVLGLVREQALAYFFGASRWMDCFIVAFRTPNMLRDMFAEGALSTAFVTTFSQLKKTDGEEAAWSLARKMLTIAALFMSLISLIGILLMPWVVEIMNYGWVEDGDWDKIEFTVLLARIMFMFITLISLCALVMGILNSHNVFFVPAVASSFFNLGSIVFGAIIGYLMDPTFGKEALIGFSVGVLIGGACQLGIQLPALWKIGFRYRPDFKWKDPAVRKVLVLMGPAVISGSAVQVGVAMSIIFASFMENGDMAVLQWSFRLMMLPIGIFGVAVAMVTLPAVSRLSTEGITDGFRSVLARGLRLVMLLTIPSAVGLFILAEPIISVIFQRGKFDLDDMHRTAAALRFYSIGLVFFAAMKVIQPTFYAIGRKWLPMWVSIGAILINIVLNSIWVFWLKYPAEYLALSTAVGSIFNFVVLYYFMTRYADHLHTRKLFSAIFRIGIATLILGVIAWAGVEFSMNGEWFEASILWKLLTLFGTIALAGGAYFATARLLKVEEMDEFVSMIRRKSKRS